MMALCQTYKSEENGTKEGFEFPEDARIGMRRRKSKYQWDLEDMDTPTLTAFTKLLRNNVHV